MVTRRWMATPAIFAFLTVVMLLGLVTLGIVTWHLASSGSGPVAVDWGSKVCKQLPDGTLAKNCRKLPVAVDWGNSKCSRVPDGSFKLGTCTDPSKPPKQVAVDWGNSASICVLNPDGGCEPPVGMVAWGTVSLTS